MEGQEPKPCRTRSPLTEPNPPHLKKGMGNRMYVNLWSVYQTLGWESTCRSRGHGTTLIYFLRPLGHAKNSGVQKWIWNMVSHPFPRDSRLAVEHGLRQEYEDICEMEKKYMDPPTPWGGSQVQDPPNSGLPLPFPRVLLCPLNISKWR